MYRLVTPTEWLTAVYRLAPDATLNMLNYFFDPQTPSEIQARAREVRTSPRAAEQALEAEDPARFFFQRKAASPAAGRIIRASPPRRIA